MTWTCKCPNSTLLRLGECNLYATLTAEWKTEISCKVGMKIGLKCLKTSLRVTTLHSMLVVSSIVTTAITGRCVITIRTRRLRGCKLDQKWPSGAEWHQHDLSVHISCETPWIQTAILRCSWPTVLGLDNIGDLIFIQDGAPPNLALTAHAWLDLHFPKCWKGRSGPHKLLLRIQI